MRYPPTLGRPQPYMPMQACAQRVYFDGPPLTPICWADSPTDLLGCPLKSETDIGLCFYHYREIVSG